MWVKKPKVPFIPHQGNHLSPETSSSLLPESGHLAPRGFTLIEVIAVLLVLGVLVAIAVGRPANSIAQAEVAGAVEIVKNHLRFAQSTAMNSDLSWGINFSGTTYSLRDSNNVTATLPGDIPQGMTFASTINPLMFDNRWGSPGTTTITVTVSKGGVSQTISVTRNTGFIP